MSSPPCTRVAGIPPSGWGQTCFIQLDESSVVLSISARIFRAAPVDGGCDSRLML
jgi:hypothetical protein